MKRAYVDGVKKDVRMFVGREIERTKFYDLLTLFVVGDVPTSEIIQRATQMRVRHIFLGANMSLHQLTHQRVTEMVQELIAFNFFVTIDGGYNEICELSGSMPFANDSKICFIAQIKMPYIENLTKQNTFIKIDDVGFRSTNPGVWVHPLSELTKEEHFTGWDRYGEDQALD